MKTELGKKLIALRYKAIDLGMKLKDQDELFPDIEEAVAELSLLRPLVEALAEYGPRWVGHSCEWCEAFTNIGTVPVEHKPDCPVLKARELVKTWKKER